MIYSKCQTYHTLIHPEVGKIGNKLLNLIGKKIKREIYVLYV